MIDIDKQISFWRNSAEEDLAMDILAEMNSFNIEGRYPDTLSPPPSQEEAQHYMTQAEEVFQWLISMF